MSSNINADLIIIPDDDSNDEIIIFPNEDICDDSDDDVIIMQDNSQIIIPDDDIQSTQTHIDISGNADAETRRNNSPHKKWIKLVPLNRTVLFAEYNNKKDFVEVASVELDDELHTSKTQIEKKKRKTHIRFTSTISKADFAETNEWLYIFTINDYIVKISGTSVSLQKRTASYLCGHHTQERNSSGKCSVTNAVIYNTFEFYLLLGCDIKMYGYKLRKLSINENILGEDVVITPQRFDAYETKYMMHFERSYGFKPFLSDNCNPAYKK